MVSGAYDLLVELDRQPGRSDETEPLSAGQEDSAPAELQGSTDAATQTKSHKQKYKLEVGGDSIASHEVGSLGFAKTEL